MTDKQDAPQAPDFGPMAALVAVLAPDAAFMAAQENEDAEAHATRVFDELTARATALVEERDQLALQLRSQKGATTRAKNKVEELQALDRPRVLRQPKEYERADPRDLLELIHAAEKVELAFIDDGKEVKGINPRRVDGSAWAVRGSKLVLAAPSMTVAGPAPDKPPHKVTGYVLLLDDEPVAWGHRGDVLSIPAGSTFELKDDVAF